VPPFFFEEGQIGLESLGKQIVVEFYGCDVNMLNKPAEIREMMEDAARNARATVIESVIHQFNPFGVSGVVVISESHLAIHTWPEYGYAAVDIFTCGEDVDPWQCFYYMQEKLKAKHFQTFEMKRGVMDFEGLRHKPKPTQPVKAAA
jgi:S-adenosylmethionine decarboxylase